MEKDTPADDGANGSNIAPTRTRRVEGRNERGKEERGSFVNGRGRAGRLCLRREHEAQPSSTRTEPLHGSIWQRAGGHDQTDG